MMNLQCKGVQQYFSYSTLQNQYCKLYFLEYIIPIIFCTYNEDTIYTMNIYITYTEIQGKQEF